MTKQSKSAAKVRGYMSAMQLPGDDCEHVEQPPCAECLKRKCAAIREYNAKNGMATNETGRSTKHDRSMNPNNIKRRVSRAKF